ncbi:nuclear transport factor 2 family protein [Pseudoduganella albidiflava]|uniref:Nuclear transport factor 2 family protein n=1 Tax=Pseudoduganella albidiflava TaxID=321983 RepID=A0A411X061_9BURK|nr:nuclear transport factor 2 family protein [Pseudoduganella albidiflava]QBI02354.1 nuclear transport factor 2 family protein [Pseudoduganella albidiflava]GGY43458.1 polyketide cyclase [Pseudoduganella albidiflava]
MNEKPSTLPPSPVLPSAVAAYIQAANDQDAAGVAACFVADGTVRDEGATRRGSAEIAAWVHDTATRYQSSIEPLAMVGDDAQCELSAVVSGNFPGSPVTLKFHFVLVPGGIASLAIGA